MSVRSLLDAPTTARGLLPPATTDEEAPVRELRPRPTHVLGALAAPASVADYLRLVGGVETDRLVLGLVLHAAPGERAVVRPDRQWQASLVVRDTDVDASLRRHAASCGASVRVAVEALSSFDRPVAELGLAERYDAVHADVVVDRLGGRIARVVSRRATLTADEAAEIAERSLAASFMGSRRSIENLRDGLVEESHLDAVECVPAFLTALFALDGRIRPSNRHLRWELEAYPLADPAWPAVRVMHAARVIATTGAMFEQRNVMRDLARLARERGLGHAVDEHDLDA